jgi:hypothetical protein
MEIDENIHHVITIFFRSTLLSFYSTQTDIGFEMSHTLGVEKLCKKGLRVKGSRSHLNIQRGREAEGCRCLTCMRLSRYKFQHLIETKRNPKTKRLRNHEIILHCQLHELFYMTNFISIFTSSRGVIYFHVNDKEVNSLVFFSRFSLSFCFDFDCQIVFKPVEIHWQEVNGFYIG